MKLTQLQEARHINPIDFSHINVIHTKDRLELKHFIRDLVKGRGIQGGANNYGIQTTFSFDDVRHIFTSKFGEPSHVSYRWKTNEPSMFTWKLNTIPLPTTVQVSNFGGSDDAHISVQTKLVGSRR